MSYILDALKKSEQDRRQGEVPGLNSFQSQPRPARSTSRIILYLLIGVLMVNVLGLGLWVISRHSDTAPMTDDLPGPVASKDTTSQPAENKAATETTETIVASAPTAPAQITTESTTPSAIEAEEAAPDQSTKTEPDIDTIEDEEPTTEVEEAPRKLIKHSALPAEVREKIGDLSISAHYYAKNPSASMVSINGRIMRQGQSVNNDLILDEITPRGVILTFHKYRFSMDVFKR